MPDLPAFSALPLLWDRSHGTKEAGAARHAGLLGTTVAPGEHRLSPEGRAALRSRFSVLPLP